MWKRELLDTTRGKFEIFTQGEGEPICVVEGYDKNQGFFGKVLDDDIFQNQLEEYMGGHINTLLKSNKQTPDFEPDQLNFQIQKRRHTLASFLYLKVEFIFVLT